VLSSLCWIFGQFTHFYMLTNSYFASLVWRHWGIQKLLIRVRLLFLPSHPNQGTSPYGTIDGFVGASQAHPVERKTRPRLPMILEEFKCESVHNEFGNIMLRQRRSFRTFNYYRLKWSAYLLTERWELRMHFPWIHQYFNDILDDHYRAYLTSKLGL
jgi:hypothetical protein